METAQAEREAMPLWKARIDRSYMAGEAHAFMLTGDIEGIALQNMSVRGFLRATLAEQRDVVAIYHIAGGIELYDADQMLTDEQGQETVTRRERALSICGFADFAQAAAMKRSTEQTLGLPIRFASDPAPQSVASLISGMGPQGAEPGDPFEGATNPAAALRLLSLLLRQGDSVAAIIDYADTLVPSPTIAGKGAMPLDDRQVLVTLQAWGKDPAINRSGNQVFLLARDAKELHPDLRQPDSGWKQIEIPLPDRDQRLVWLRWYAAAREEKRARALAEGRKPSLPLVLEDGLDLGELATLTAGLSFRNIEDLLLAAILDGALTRLFLKGYKDSVISASYSEYVTMIDPLPNGFGDIGGVEVFKDYCQRRIVRALRDGKVANVPRGIMLVGPPGTGKTYGVRALAGEIGVPCVAVETAKILGGIVGQSERALATVFAFVESLSPCIVFIDEFDQSDMAQRGDQSGNPVAKNLFNGLMQFMSNERLRGKVIVIFGSNRPDKIDPAMKRSGRIDAIIPMLLPERDERRTIAGVQCDTQLVAADDEALDWLADNTSDWNAGDLAAVIREARIEADLSGAEGIDAVLMQRAVGWLKPSGLDTAELFTNLALEAVNDVRLLPEKYRAALDNRAALEQRTRELAATRLTPLPSRGRDERDSRL